MSAADFTNNELEELRGLVERRLGGPVAARLLGFLDDASELGGSNLVTIKLTARVVS